MSKGISQRIDEIEKHGNKCKVENVCDVIEGILSGRIKSKPDPMVEALFIEVEKERKKMKKNNGKAQSDDYTLIES